MTKRVNIHTPPLPVSPRSVSVGPRSDPFTPENVLRTAARSGNEIPTKTEDHRTPPPLRFRKRFRDHADRAPGRTVPGPESEPNEESDVEELTKDKKIKPNNIKPPPPRFFPGQTVEIRSDDVGFEGSWYAAEIIDSIGKSYYHVEYHELLTNNKKNPLREAIHSKYIRPNPPRLQVDRFKMLDKVDVWYNDGWWEGVVSRHVTDQTYVVYFSTTVEESVYSKSQMRLHQDWVDEKWVLAWEANLESNLSNNIGSDVAMFRKGTKVEVRRDNDSLFVAVIVGAVGDGEYYLVEYRTLRSDGGTELLKEEVAGSEIRPCSPEIQRVYSFGRLEVVDVWYNEGWWKGYVSEIVDDRKYKVYFRWRDEEMVVGHSELRPHWDWVRGQWVPSSEDHITI